MIKPFVERSATRDNVKTKIICYDTTRICEICKGVIFKKLQKEIDLKRKRLLSKIVVWDERLTCCGDCRYRRLKRFNDNDSMDEGELVYD